MRHPEDMLVKICGVANMEDASLADSLGADIIGVVLDYSYARHGSPELVSSIHDSGIVTAGVYTSIDSIIEGFRDEDLIQMHFDHSPNDVRFLKKETGKGIISVIRLDGAEGTAEKARAHYEAGAEIVLVEHGKGIVAELPRISKLQKVCRTGVAGKISPSNVSQLANTEPLMIDASSSIEQYPGKKDPELLRQFFINLEAQDAVS